MTRPSRSAISLALLLSSGFCQVVHAKAPGSDSSQVHVDYAVADLRNGTRTNDDVLSSLRSLSIAAGASTRVLVQEVSAEGDWRLRLTAEQHAVFEDLLDGLRRGGTRQVVLTTRWLELTSLKTLDHVDLRAATRFPSPEAIDSPEELVRVTGEEAGQTTVQDYQPYLAASLPREQSVELLDRVQRDSKANLLSAPNLTALNGQRTSITDLSQTPYVIGVERVVGASGEGNQPIIAVVSSGRTLGLRAVALEGGSVELDLCLASTQIDGDEVIRLPGARDLAVQSPRVSKSVVRAKRVLKEGESVLLAPTVLPDKTTGRFACCLITASVLEPVKSAYSAPRIEAISTLANSAAIRTNR